MQLDSRLWNPAVIVDVVFVLCCFITAAFRSAESYRQWKIRKKSQARAEQELESLFGQYDELQTLVNRITREARELKRKHSEYVAPSSPLLGIDARVLTHKSQYLRHLTPPPPTLSRGHGEDVGPRKPSASTGDAALMHAPPD